MHKVSKYTSESFHLSIKGKKNQFKNKQGFFNYCLGLKTVLDTLKMQKVF